MKSFRYVISGGTGWLGQELIYALLERKMVSDLSEICIFSSQEKRLDFERFGSINSTSFLANDFREFGDVDSFIHLAFLTRNLIDKYGLTNYINTNRRLTSQAQKFIERAKPSLVVNISSGAVFSRATGDFENNIYENPYGYLKLAEEHALAECCERLSTNLTIGRLWGATGLRMPVNCAYAISDFITQALLDKRIIVNSSQLVWRRYCDAAEFMLLLILVAKHNKFSVIDSGGPKIELAKLAEMIGGQIGDDICISRTLLQEGPPDDYYPRSDLYEKLSASLSLELSDLSRQIQRTIDGHRIQLRHRGLRSGP